MRITKIKKASSVLGATVLLFALTACSGGGGVTQTEPTLNGDGSISVDAGNTGSIAPSSRSAATIEEAYLTFWSAVAAQQFESAAAIAHPEWLAEIGEDYGYPDDAAAAIKAALYSQSFNDVWTEPEYASGWEASIAFTSENFPYGYVPEQDPEVTRAAYEARLAEDPAAFTMACQDLISAATDIYPASYGGCVRVLDSDADHVGVNIGGDTQIRAVNSWSAGSNISRGTDGGWQFDGAVMP